MIATFYRVATILCSFLDQSVLFSSSARYYLHNFLHFSFRKGFFEVVLASLSSSVINKFPHPLIQCFKSNMPHWFVGLGFRDIKQSFHAFILSPVRLYPLSKSCHVLISPCKQKCSFRWVMVLIRLLPPKYLLKESISPLKLLCTSEKSPNLLFN